MPCVALDAVQPARMNGHNRSLHIDQIVLAQSAHPFSRGVPTSRLSDVRLPRSCAVFRALRAISNECAIAGENVQRLAYLHLAEFTALRDRVSFACRSADLRTGSEVPNRLLDLRCQRGVIVAAQAERSAERHADPPRTDERGPDRHQAIDVFELTGTTGRSRREAIIPMPPRNGFNWPVGDRTPSGNSRIDVPLPVTSPMYCSVCRAPASRCGIGKVLKKKHAR